MHHVERPSGCGKSTFLKTLNRMNDRWKMSRLKKHRVWTEPDIFQDLDAIARHRVGTGLPSSRNLFPKSAYNSLRYGSEDLRHPQNPSWMRS
ncbi:MAG: hypothetical protein ACLRPV_10380 [Lacrimispora saccharolytica]